MEDIIVRKNQDGSFDLHQWEKYAEYLTWHEMLGLLAALTTPSPAIEIHWMKTAAQHEAHRKPWLKRDTNEPKSN